MTDSSLPIAVREVICDQCGWRNLLECDQPESDAPSSTITRECSNSLCRNKLGADDADYKCVRLQDVSDNEQVQTE